MKTSSNSRSAFSLIELSIVILIIGIIIAGVTQSSRLINKSKLSNARTLTQSSPASSINDMILWVESTSEDSFIEDETEDNTEITAWYDINPQASLKAHFEGTADATPLYDLDVINGLPAIKFGADSGGADEFMSSSNFPGIVDSSTVFLVVKTPATLALEPIFSKRPSAAFGSSAPNIQVGLQADGDVSYCDDQGTSTGGSTCNYTSSAALTSTNTAYIVSIVYNDGSSSGGGTTAATGISFFVNGAAQGQADTLTSGTPATLEDPATPDTLHTPGSTTADLFLGKDGTTSANFFTGHIGELIIYDRNLKKEERQAVESYLGSKWQISTSAASY